MKEQIEKKVSYHNFVGRYKLVVATCVIIVLALTAAIYIYFRKPTDQISGQQSTATEGTIKAIDDNTGNQPSSDQSEQEVKKTAEDYYSSGQQFMTKSEWEKSIISFEEAIKLDNKNPNYYSRKSQAEYNLGQKDQAIATLNEGLKNNPESDLLKSRLDVLQKDYVGSQPQ